MIKTYYVYDREYIDIGCVIPYHREIPSKHAELTGIWKTVNNKIYVQVNEKSKKFFGGETTKLKWTPEEDFSFEDIIYHDCNGVIDNE